MKAKLTAALKVWIVIYPSITLLQFFSAERLVALPLYLRTLIITAVLVPWMTFVGVPVLNFMIGRLAGKQQS